MALCRPRGENVLSNRLSLLSSNGIAATRLSIKQYLPRTGPSIKEIPIAIPRRPIDDARSDSHPPTAEL